MVFWRRQPLRCSSKALNEAEYLLLHVSFIRPTPFYTCLASGSLVQLPQIFLLGLVTSEVHVLRLSNSLIWIGVRIFNEVSKAKYE